MPRLTTKLRLSMSFSLYVFFFLLIFGVVIFFVYQFLLNKQVSTLLNKDMYQVTTEYLKISQDGLMVKSGKDGRTLKEFFLEESVASLILDQNLNVYKAYGIMALVGADNELNALIEVIRADVKDDKIKTREVTFQKRQITILVVPIKNNNQLAGVLVLGKPMGDFDEVEGMIFLTVGALGLLVLLGSFLLGSILANYAFGPTQKIIKSVEKIDLNRLDKTISIEGHPEDELSILSQTLNKMLQRLKVTAQKQKDFVSNASHELKTPLTRAISSLDIIKIRKSNTLVKAEEAKNDLLEMGSLINNLLLISSLDSSKLPKGVSNLLGVLKSVFKKQKDLLKSKKIKKNIKVQSKVYIDIPEEYLQIILSNIITNAIKYTQPDTVISLNNKIVNNLAILEVSDQGIGMDNEELEKIFDRFYRSSKAKKIERGYGLGLSIVKQICDIYHINITINTEKNKGTSVLLKFPLSQR